MAHRILTRHELNRATLARQLLLERADLSAPAAVERLAGLQSQLAAPPFVGLWSRLRDFQRGDLAAAIADRSVVRATWVRATLHLCTAADYLRFRATLQPALTGAAARIADHFSVEVDRDTVLAAAREFIDERPRTFAQISAMLTERMPGQEVGPLRYTVRTHLPLVQVPVPGGWCYLSQPAFTLAESWLGRPVAAEADLPELVRRYLAAFGPASVADLQTWSGLTGLQAAVSAMKPDLVVYQAGRREWFDLPASPPPDGDLPAPVRLLPEFDNLLLSHRDRSRVIADEHRSRVYLPGLRVRATFLVDGFVAGAWKIERAKGAAALVIEPFIPLAAADREALAGEAGRLVRFVAPESRSFVVRFADAG